MGAILLFFVIAVSVAVYFIPTRIAYKRKLANRETIFALNALLGWTLICWACCLGWALSGTAKIKDDAAIAPTPKTFGDKFLLLCFSAFLLMLIACAALMICSR